MSKTKSYEISKHVVLEAFQRVKANGGAAGVDNVSLEKFESNLKNNLYKIWNRMSSGSYFPPPGEGGRNTQENGRYAHSRNTHCGGPSSANGR
ncbi:hypothetical protein DNHGIG_17210 [Collibacillus ludicampi]|uniref:Group II intron reverse transcriptase/maturase n=1 Tax=Collibacillus ludicampi TaxID=2771369 RepID=A0AAV4LEE3_9BACL|nr:hypothetical protein DNHGIG_17210 [Collibacillus ludicampi]